MEYKWNHHTLPPDDIDSVMELASETGTSLVAMTMMWMRGIRTADAVREYFRPQLHGLHDPFLMKDMDIAVNRLNQAMGNKERIMVYGDYDVDGCTAVALVYKYICQFYSNIEYYIPDRYEEGYGVSLQGINQAHANGVKLIIVLDCGIKAIDEIQYAKDLGIDFIICDHHVPGEVLPPAIAILNAKRKDNTYPYLDLSGCGVGFKFMQAFARSNNMPFSTLIPLLDLAAVSIASDIVPIMGENRIMAFHGLRQLNNNPCVGLKAIIDVCGLTGRDLTMNDIIFKIGPRINASGRMQNGRESVSMLVEHDYAEAHKMAEQINQYNAERKELDRQMTDEAQKQVEEMLKENDKRAIVIYNEEWHKGVIGIVASRLTESFFRPAVVLTRSGNTMTGSARSITGFDVYKAIQSCADLLDNFGGHTYAAGLSLEAKNVDEFARRFEEYVDNHIDEEQTQAMLDIDIDIDFSEITPKFINDLKRMRPYGPDNVKPVFCTHHVYDYGTSKVVGHNQDHIKMELVDNCSNQVMNGIAFGQSYQAHYIKSKRAFDIVYTIEDNTFKRGDVQLQILDIRTQSGEVKSEE